VIAARVDTQSKPSEKLFGFDPTFVGAVAAVALSLLTLGVLITYIVQAITWAKMWRPLGKRSRPLNVPILS
jgi:hypothetical protein